jgi:peptide deformylase
VATTDQLTPGQLARREAALARVRKYGDPVLREQARPVAEVDDVVRDQIREMTRLLGDAMEAGLAATQIGVLNRVFVYRGELDGPIRALVNPELEWASEEIDVAEEGCLSIPGIWVEVERPARVRMRGLDEQGEPVVIDAELPEARVLQHELDHLDGVLTLDRTTKEQRRQALRELRRRQALATDEQSKALDGVVQLLERKSGALGRIRRHMRIKAFLEVWLYIHVPLTFALIAALTAHIISVFFYW